MLLNHERIQEIIRSYPCSSLKSKHLAEVLPRPCLDSLQEKKPLHAKGLVMSFLKWKWELKICSQMLCFLVSLVFAVKLPTDFGQLTATKLHTNPSKLTISLTSWVIMDSHLLQRLSHITGWVPRLGRENDQCEGEKRSMHKVCNGTVPWKEARQNHEYPSIPVENAYYCSWHMTRATKSNHKKK